MSQVQQVAVVRPKLVAPFGDAMGLVDGDEAQLQVAEEAAERGCGQALGGDVQQLAPPGPDFSLHPVNLRT